MTLEKTSEVVPPARMPTKTHKSARFPNPLARPYTAWNFDKGIDWSHSFIAIK